MSAFRLILSARHRLLCLQLVALLPLAIVLVLFGLFVRSEHRQEEFNRRMAAEDLTHELHVFLTLNQSGIDLASRMVARKLAGSYAILNESLRTHSALTSLVATTPEGQVTVTCGDKTDSLPFGRIIAADPVFNQVRASLKPHVSGVAVDPNDADELLITLTLPILDRLGRFDGVVQGTLDIAAYTSHVASLGRFHNYAFIITDSGGRIIHAPAGSTLRPLDFLPGLPGSLTGDYDGADYVARHPDSPFRVVSLNQDPVRSIGFSHRWMLFALLAAAVSTALIMWRIAVRTREVEVANASKSAFLAMTSHEIRTPLNAIIGLSDCLIGQTRDPEARDHLTTIRSAGELLLHVVSDLLDLSRVEAGRLELRPGPVEIGSLAREVCTLFALQASRQQLALNLELALPPGLRVEIDGDRLRQVLINLVGNALKFTRQGSVRLRIEPTGEHEGLVTLRFSVVDTGPGIPDAARARLFEPYFRIRQPGSGGPEGTGLGLNISRRIVALLGGTLDLRTRIDVGSEFFFELSLPLLPAAAGPASADAAQPGIASLRVLAVDDNPANQEVLHALLDGRCARLVVVGSAQEALRELRATPFDVALIDLEMPGGDGFLVARSLLDEPGASCGCRLIAVSSHSPGVMRDRCLASGFSDFIAKPLRKKLLCDLIETAPSSASAS